MSKFERIRRHVMMSGSSTSSLYPLNWELGTLSATETKWLTILIDPYMMPQTKTYHTFWGVANQHAVALQTGRNSKSGKYVAVMIASYIPRNILSEYKTTVPSTQKWSMQILEYAELVKTKNKETLLLFANTRIIRDLVKIILSYAPECGRVGAVISICDKPPPPKTEYKHKKRVFR